MKQGIGTLRKCCLSPGLLLVLCAGAFLLSACATKPTLSITHTPRENDPLVESPERRPAPLLVQVTGSRDRVWYRVGEKSWLLEKDPTDIVKEALEAELQTGMGLPVTDDLRFAAGRLEVEIRWFAPYGHSYLTAAVILSLTLYQNESEHPVWRGRLQGGEYTRPPVFTLRGCDRIVEDMANKALGKAVEQLRWKPGFREAVHRLADTGSRLQ